MSFHSNPVPPTHPPSAHPLFADFLPPLDHELNPAARPPFIDEDDVCDLFKQHMSIAAADARDGDQLASDGACTVLFRVFRRFFIFCFNFFYLSKIPPPPLTPISLQRASSASATASLCGLARASTNTKSCCALSPCKKGARSFGRRFFPRFWWRRHPPRQLRRVRQALGVPRRLPPHWDAGGRGSEDGFFHFIVYTFFFLIFLFLSFPLFSFFFLFLFSCFSHALHRTSGIAPMSQK